MKLNYFGIIKYVTEHMEYRGVVFYNRLGNDSTSFLHGTWKIKNYDIERWNI